MANAAFELDGARCVFMNIDSVNERTAMMVDILVKQQRALAVALPIIFRADATRLNDSNWSIKPIKIRKHRGECVGSHT